MKLIRELKLSYPAPKRQGPIISSPEMATKIVYPLFAESGQEIVVALYLDQKNQLLGTRVVSIGTVSECMLHPRDVFAGAILTLASGIILSHNHPSGVLKPSLEDILLTKRVKNGCEILLINFTDHVIVSPTGEYLSMKESGHLE